MTPDRNGDDVGRRVVAVDQNMRIPGRVVAVKFEPLPVFVLLSDNHEFFIWPCHYCEEDSWVAA